MCNLLLYSRQPIPIAYLQWRLGLRYPHLCFWNSDLISFKLCRGIILVACCISFLGLLAPRTQYCSGQCITANLAGIWLNVARARATWPARYRQDLSLPRGASTMSARATSTWAAGVLWQPRPCRCLFCCNTLARVVLHSTMSTRKYSSPSISGHSQGRPPSLMWPEIFVATTMNAFTSPSRQRSPL